MLLVNRLDKRITILRPPMCGEWLATASCEGAKSYPGDQSYSGESPAHEYWDNWHEPDSDYRDEYGQPDGELVEVCKIWAAIEPLQGREYFAAMQVNADVTTRIRIRYREGIDRTMIAKHGDTEFEILYVLHPQFGKKELQLMCKERQ